MVNHRVLASVVGLGLGGVAIWLLASPRPEAPRPPTASASSGPSATPASAEAPDGPSQGDEVAPPSAVSSSSAAAYQGPVTDRERADALRELLLSQYAVQQGASGAGPAAGEPAASGSAAPPVTAPAMPAPVGDGNQAKEAQGRYVGKMMREQFVPLAGSCYEELLERQPAAAGHVELRFSIVGDAGVGGVVVDVTLGEATTLKDTAFETCVRESMYGVIFDAPPAGSPVVTVTQSFTLEP